EAGADACCSAGICRGRLEEEIRIAEEGEGRLTSRVRCAIHVKQLLRPRIHDGALKLRPQTVSEQALRQASVRIDHAQAGHGPLELADGAIAGKRLARYVSRSRIVEMDRERSCVAG